MGGDKPPSFYFYKGENNNMEKKEYKGFCIEVKPSATKGAWYARVTLLEDIPKHGLVSEGDTWDTPPCESEDIAYRYGEAMTRGIQLRGSCGGMFKIRDGVILR